ncbi:MAG: SsrA-binding protein SmpB [Verrucomicrobia bacterium]|jgi:SsrA-binding protein|nr:SsrA-binding protein SmpB [Verrucomicrobiota bacterium]
MSAKAKKERYKEVRNNRVHRDYFVEERLEAGIVLRGTEVKSIRQGMAQINDAFVRIERGTPTLYHAHISEYAFGTDANHNPYRPRKLLLNRREIRRWEQQLQSGGRTLVPLRLYFKQGLVKAEIGLCRGKKQYDKREDLKRKADELEADRALKQHLR